MLIPTLSATGSAAQPPTQRDDFAATFFDVPTSEELGTRAERIATLATHPFYLRLQRHWLYRKAGRADEYSLVAAQSRFAQRLMAQPLLGLVLPGDEHRLSAFVSNHARNIATLVVRANRFVGTTAIDPDELSTGSAALDDLQWRDFVATLHERCQGQLDEAEHLVACFRWFLRWSVAKTGVVLGLSAAQVKYRETSARQKVGAWIADTCGLANRC